jgi:N-acyl-phosphatidylethanolamine-hydrolysing phospholipase D
MMFRLRLLPLLLWLTCSPTALVAESSTLHHAGKTFTNPYAEEEPKGFFGIVRARLSDDWIAYNKDRDQVPTVAHGVLPSGTTRNNATVTWIGHATVLIQHKGINVLTDPIFSEFASPVSFAGPKRITQPALALSDLPTIHAVVLSHDHYDHLDQASIKQLGDAPMYYVPVGIKRWLIRQGIDSSRVVEMDWWDKTQLSVEGVELTFTSTPAQHFSGRGLFNRNQTLWSSWHIAWGDFHVWFGGDTGYNDVQFKQIGDRLGSVDLAIIPIGAYKPRWFMQTVHVNPEEAIKIHRDVKATRSLGIHWGAFVLSGEGVLTPPEDLKKARETLQMPTSAFEVWAVGETRHFPSRPL